MDRPLRKIHDDGNGFENGNDEHNHQSWTATCKRELIHLVMMLINPLLLVGVRPFLDGFRATHSDK